MSGINDVLEEVISKPAEVDINELRGLAKKETTVLKNHDEDEIGVVIDADGNKHVVAPGVSIDDVKESAKKRYILDGIFTKPVVSVSEFRKKKMVDDFWELYKRPVQMFGKIRDDVPGDEWKLFLLAKMYNYDPTIMVLIVSQADDILRSDATQFLLLGHKYLIGE